MKSAIVTEASQGFDFKGSVKSYFFGLLFILGVQTATAQKNLIISDSLKANAEMLKIKMGGQITGKMPKFKVGEYAVVSGKLGWIHSSSTSNFFNTKSESKSSQKFSFVLASQGSDSAKVDAATNTQLQTHNSVQVSEHFSWGDDELLKQSINFSAYISLSSDTSKVWVLVMQDETGSQTNGKSKAFLTDGARRIQIFPVSSDSNGQHSLSPALGYEFVEIGKSVSALQYSGGGMFPLNHNIIWLHKDIDPQMKLVLAAAMIAILQLKFSQQVGQ
jgi:hypothetical protein